ncbi:hypothetical protein [Pedobacter metabolipauper]|uniref:Uncharacterized protein n=1 Tax=Pedobacter metabolipauper TaxID=425513 RepID=A0A4R6T212_9SPHI|nr:hypothetical protein [Pedobacter metabolipauper]TDQ11361.1 hypothetical protein ATK78_0479 [Pedobacter metabolipauper]
MSKLKNLVAGLAGAIALNILHETLRHKKDDVPRIDLLGEDALQKVLRHFSVSIGNKDDLYKATLAGDVIGNAFYYSLIGTGGAGYIWPKALVLGIGAGIGAVTLPEPLGLDDEPVTKTDQVKVLTVGYYVFGALVTATVLKLLSRK